MSEWQEVTLQDVVSVLGDGLHGTPIYDDNGEYFFVNGNNLSNGKILLKESTRRASESEYLKYKKPLNNRTILLSINSTLGNVALYNNEKCFLGKSACYFNVKEDVDKQYIRYVVTNKSFQTYITEFSHGTTIQNLSLKTLREFPFELPSHEEQKAIASVLSSLDDKIDLLHRQNTTLERMAETLFRQWFVEEAQENWEVGTLKEFVEIGIGRTPPRQEHQWFSESEIDIKWISIKDLGNDGAYIFKTSEYLTKEAVTKFNIPIIPKDTVVLSFKMTLGRVAITTLDMLSNEAIAHFKFNAKTPFTKEYLFLFLKTYKWEMLGSTSSIVTSINSAMIKDMEIAIPDVTSMNKFRKATEPLFEKIKSNQQQIHILEKLRDNLLPKLMSGEVRVNLA